MTNNQFKFYVNQRVSCDVWELLPMVCPFGKVVEDEHPYYVVDFCGKEIRIHGSALQSF